MKANEVGKSVSREVGQERARTYRLTDSRLSDSEHRTARLRRAIANLRAAGMGDRPAHATGPAPRHAEPVDLTPKSAHEAITRQMVTDLAADVAEVKTRVNAVLWLVAGAVAVDVVMRLAGVG